MKIRDKTCRHCKTKFTPFQSSQVVCGWQCAQAYAESQRSKKEKKEYLLKKAKLKSRAQWLRECQTVFNQYIRERDRTEPCISCGRYHDGQYHAGHYLTIGARPELRFNELNVWKQCAPCNNHLSGNLINYRINLVQKIGIDKVEMLEGHHEQVKYTVDDLMELKAKYKSMIKSLNRG